MREETCVTRLPDLHPQYILKKNVDEANLQALKKYIIDNDPLVGVIA